jgi:zinc protease
LIADKEPKNTLSAVFILLSKMLDRKIAPPLREISNLQLPNTELIHLDNGIPVHIIRMGTQAVVKLELIFNAGRWYEDKLSVSRATAQLLKEGTKTRSGKEIAEMVDFYGASIGFPANLDTSNVILFCLTKHFEKLLPLLDDLLTMPAFAEDEVERFKKRSLRKLKMDLGKPDVVAYRQITESIFGKKHPYGYNSQPKIYSALERADLVRHFEKHYRAGNCSIVLSGRPTDNVLDLLNKTLGRNLPKGHSVPKEAILKPNPNQRLYFPKEKALQSAVKVGRKLFNRTHEDYNGMYVLNTILGGYFGARLMTNLREDKGFTYGVYSMVEPMCHDGYFYISTEVNKGSAQAALHEIYKEFRRLREEPISDTELYMVKNYLKGYLLTWIDGPFNTAEVIRILVAENVGFNFYEELVETIQNITPAELQLLANKYFQEEDMFEVIAG